MKNESGNKTGDKGKSANKPNEEFQKQKGKEGKYITLIIELFETANEKQLERLYLFIKEYLA